MRQFAMLALAFVCFTRLDGHKLWFDPVTGVTVQGGEQVGFHRGTLLTASGVHYVVRENINQVMHALGVTTKCGEPK
jgi:uncharacterized protein YlzI (FlbEa/FlbD family)